MGVASTTFMTMVGLSVNRDGVRIEAPHDLQEHDEHKIWTKKNTWHWETGWVWHLTQGQVLHVDANLVETHINMSPIQIHMGLMPLGLTVHAEASHFRKHINLHGGHHHDVMREFSQHAQVVSIETKKTRTTFGALADIGKDPLNAGKMTLGAEGAMSLYSDDSIRLLGGPGPKVAALSLSKSEGEAVLFSKKQTVVSSATETVVAGGDNSLISLKKGDLDLKSGAASVKLSQGNLTTNATETRLNGRVTLGQPAATDIATPEHVVEILEFIAGGDDLTDLKTRIAALRASLNL
jgi:hypothetical protein